MARSTRVSRNAAEAGRKSQIASKKAAIQILCECVHEDAVANDGKLPHGYMKAFVEHQKKTWSWMTRDLMNAAYRRFKERLKEEESVAQEGSERKPPEQVTTTLQAVNSSSMSDLSGDSTTSRSLDSNSRSKGGRPMGSTKERKRIEAEEVMNAKNEVITMMRNATSK